MNDYDILGIKEGATTKEIKKAYRTLAQKYHPDKENGNKTFFLKVKQAYERLIQKRKSKQTSTRPKKPTDLFKSDDDVCKVFGFLKTTWKKYYACNSKFKTHNTDVLTKHIYGKKKSYLILSLTLSEVYNGTKIQTPGNGYLDIPPGTKTSDTFEDGLFEYLIVITNENGFSLIDDDIHYDMTLDLEEVLTGTKKDIVHPNGKTYTIKVPVLDKIPTTIKLPNLGFPFFQNSEQKGDLKIKCKVDLSSLTDEKRSAIMSQNEVLVRETKTKE